MKDNGEYGWMTALVNASEIVFYGRIMLSWIARTDFHVGIMTDKDLLESLAAAGYQLDDGPEGAGIFAKSATQGGGFYIDMGCAELVAQKEVDVRYATVMRLESEGVVIQDRKTNTESLLSADVIVYATGFETMDQWVAQLCGDRIAHEVGRTWGLGLGTSQGKDRGPWEGELRNMWKPTTVDGLWFHGGNLAQSRHYSRFLSLQLAARYLDLEPHVYGTPSPTPSIGESRELDSREKLPS